MLFADDKEASSVDDIRGPKQPNRHSALPAYPIQASHYPENHLTTGFQPSGLANTVMIGEA